MKKAFFSGILTLLFVSFGVLICEITIRILSPEIFTSNTERFQFHPKFGWTHKPNAIVYSSRRGEKPSRYEFNRFGYRDITHLHKKPSRTKRIILIGDSFSAATQVDMEKTFWWKLKQDLNKNSFYRWEILNFGVGAYGTLQEYMTLMDQGMKYVPDMIIFQFFPLNDITDNVKEAAFLSGPQNYYRPYFYADGSHQGITYFHPTLSKLRTISHLVRFIEPLAYRAYRKITNYPELGSEEDAHAQVLAILKKDRKYGVNDFQQPGKDVILLNTFSHPNEQMDIIKKGWNLTEIIIKKIFQAGKDKKIPLIMTIMPHEIQLEPKYSAYKKKLPYLFDKNYADNRLKQLADQYQVPTLSLINIFEDNLQKVLPYIDGHLNENAHILVAEKLLQQVRALISEPLDFNLRIDFNLASADKAFTLVSGFESPENTHTWTSAPDASVALHTQTNNIDTEAVYLLYIEAIPFSPPQLGNQQYVTVTVNDTLIGKWDLPVQKSSNTHTFKLQVPGEILRLNDNRIVLSFTFSTRKSPKDLGLSEDPRQLGLALLDVGIRRQK